MKKTKYNNFSFFVYAFFLILTVTILYISFIYLMLISCSKKCSGNTTQELLRIKIYGSSYSEQGDTVSGTFSIIDSNGNEMAVIERSWSGSYLSIDFSKCKINNEHYIFPTQITGKTTIFDSKKHKKSGTDLSRYYNENGQCMLLGYGSSLKQRMAMYFISNYTLKKYMVFDLFKKTSSLSVDLSGCKTGLYYSIKSTDKGDLVIQEL